MHECTVHDWKSQPLRLKAKKKIKVETCFAPRRRRKTHKPNIALVFTSFTRQSFASNPLSLTHTTKLHHITIIIWSDTPHLFSFQRGTYYFNIIIAFTYYSSNWCGIPKPIRNFWTSFIMGWKFLPLAHELSSLNPFGYSLCTPFVGMGAPPHPLLRHTLNWVQTMFEPLN